MNSMKQFYTKKANRIIKALTIWLRTFFVMFLAFLVLFGNIAYAFEPHADRSNSYGMKDKTPQETVSDHLDNTDTTKDAEGIEPINDRENSDDKPSYINGEVIARFKEGVEPERVLSSMRHFGLYITGKEQFFSIKSKIKKAKKDLKLKKDKAGWYWFLGKNYEDTEDVPYEELFRQVYSRMSPEEKKLARTYKLSLAPVVRVEEAVEMLQMLPAVEYAEPNYICEAFSTPLPNVSYIPNDYYVRDNVNPSFFREKSWRQSYPDMWGLQKIKAFEAWNLYADPKQDPGKDVVVAVIDTGVDYTHPDLAANMWVGPDGVYGHDFANDDSDPMDGHGHGTHVAGTIAAVGNNSIGVVGVAPNVRIMALKGLDDEGYGSAFNLADCVIWAVDNGADITNNSWRSGDAANAIRDAFQYAHTQNVVSIAAAGNSNADAVGFTPANLPTTITVAAFDQNDAKCSFSNYGIRIDVAAPGGGIYNELGTGSDDQSNILSTMPNGTTLSNLKPNLKVSDGYYRLAGTSMACPHVTGVAALIKSRNPDFTNEEIRQVLKASADDVGEPGWDQYSGSGRINAFEALQIDSICTAVITSPYESYDSQIESDLVDIMGSASGQNFVKYTLEYAELSGNSVTWVPFYSSRTQVNDGLLGQLDTLLLSAGEGRVYIKLKVNDTLGRTYEHMTSFKYCNIKITYPVSTDIHRAGSTIEIRGTVSDRNLDHYEIKYYNPYLNGGWRSEGISLVNGGTQAIYNGVLAYWDTAPLVDVREYPITLRLVTYRTTGNSNYVDKDYIIISSYVKENWPITINYNVENGAYGWLRPTYAVANIDSDAELEIIVCMSGNPAKIYAFNPDGSQCEGSWPAEVSFKDPEGDFVLFDKENPPIVADLDSDGTAEIMVIKDDNRMLDEGYLMSDYRDIVVFNHDGTVYQQWNPDSAIANTVFTDMAVANLDGIGDLEVILGGVMGRDHLTITDKTGGIISQVSLPEHYGSGNVIRHIAVGDIDSDSQLEVLRYGTDYFDDSGVYHSDLYAINMDGSYVPGWPVNVLAGGRITLADLDGDSKDEVIVPDNYGEDFLYVIDNDGYMNPDGPMMPGWPQRMAGTTRSGVIPGDVDGDGNLELVTATTYGINNRVFNHDGSTLIDVRGYWYGYNKIPLLVDLTGDGGVDILGISPFFPASYSYIKATQGDRRNEPIDYFPRYGPRMETTPTVLDIDNDGQLELINVSIPPDNINDINAMGGIRVVVWDLNAPAVEGGSAWPMYKHDTCGTNRYVAMAVGGNRPPVLSPIGNKTVLEGSTLSFSISATDPDGDAVTYSASNLPSGATFTASTKTFSWTPSYSQAGTYPNVRFTASDGNLTDSEDITITVTEVITYTLTINATNGSVTKNPNQPTYDYGAVVTLTATPATDYTFTGWDGDLSGTTNPATITMTSNKTVTATFKIKRTLIIKKTGNANGTAKVNGVTKTLPYTDYFADGINVDIQAEPSPTSVFTGWSGASTSTSPSITITMNSNKTVTATFKIKRTLTINKTGNGDGTAKVNGVTKTLPYTDYFADGTNVDIQAEPSPTSVFTGWSGASTSTSPSITLTMNSNKTVTANFSINTYTLSGRITLPSQTKGVNSRDVTVTRTDGSVAGTADTNLDGYYTVSGLLPGTYTVTPSYVDEVFDPAFKTVSIGESSVTGVDFIQKCKIEGYVRLSDRSGVQGITVSAVFGDTTESATTLANGSYKIYVGRNGTYDVTPSDNRPNVSRKYAFDPEKKSIPINDWNFIFVNFTALPRYIITASAGSGGTIAPSGTVGVVEGASQTFTITANTGYRIEDVKVDTVSVGAVSTYTFNNVITDHTIHATFKRTYALTVNIVGSGTVTKDPVGPTYPEGAVVTLTASPATGYTFTGWSGDLDLSGTTNPAQITMNSNKAVTATFTINTYTLTVDIVGSGTVTKNPDQQTYEHGTVVTLTATPAAGHAFTGWSGDLSGITNPTQLTMNSNKTVTANFEQRTFYSISGRVTHNGLGLLGVTVTESVGGWSDTTDGSGNYTISGLSNGGHTVTPSMSGYSFTPISRTVTISNANVTGQNFSAQSGIFISGRVTLSNGQGAQGVTVWAHCQNPEIHRSAVTDTNGDYALTDIVNGTYRVIPEKAGYTFSLSEQVITVSGASVPGVNFTAYPPPATYSIYGRVTYIQNGSAIALIGATVTAEGGGITKTGIANSEGYYGISGLEDGITYTVTPSKDDWIFDPSSPSVTINGSSVNNINFTGTRLYAISGSIFGLAGVTITATATSGGASFTATSGTSGNYAVKVPNGTYTVTPAKAGWVFSPASRSVTVNGAPVSGQNFSATGAYSISGRVTLNGSGLSGVSVAASGAGGYTTGSDGKYTISGLQNGKTYTITASKQGITFEPTSHRLTINGANITGKDFTGTPLPITHTITATAGQGGSISPSGNVSVTHGANKTFTITANAGYQIADVYVDGASVGAVSTYIFTNVTTDSHTIHATFSIIPTYSISGRETLNTGWWLGGVTMTAVNTRTNEIAGSTTSSGSSGNYTISGLQNGTYTVTPSKAGYAFNPPSRSVTIDNANVTGQNFTAFLQTYSVSGRVTYNGQGLSGVAVQAGTRTKSTDANGNYTITGLTNGTYTMILFKQGFTFSSPSSFNITINGANVTGKDFTATPEGGGDTYSISGTVYDVMNGGGMPLVRVTITSPGMQPVWVYTDTTPGLEGRYEVTDLPDNRQYTVTPEYFYGQFFPASVKVNIDGYPVDDVNFWWWSE